MILRSNGVFLAFTHRIVRRRCCRSPQAGAAAHACTDGPARTAPADASTFRDSAFRPCPLTSHGEPRPASALPSALQSRGFGGNHSPRWGMGQRPICPPIPLIPPLSSLPSLSSCRASGGCRRRGGRSGGRAGGRCRGRYGRRSPDARLRLRRRGRPAPGV